MPTGTCSIEEFIQGLQERSAARAGNASPDSTTLSEREVIELHNSLAEELARELELWMPFQETDNLGVPMPSGVENTVYYNSSEDMMYKMNNLMTSRSVLRLLQRLNIHNSLFPQTAYELVGFTGFGRGSIYPILRQQYVPNATYATHGEILDYMESLGFAPIGEAAFANGTIEVRDLRPRNVLKTPSGSIFVVDADFRLL